MEGRLFSGDESFWEECDDFGVDVLRFHTCLTDILGFLEKLEWWFEQDIDDEKEEDKEGEGGSEKVEGYMVRGEEDERKLFQIGEVGVVLFYGGEGGEGGRP
ncbi:hypothetical protein Tco_0281559 [Tanacetum coccineum]